MYLNQEYFSKSTCNIKSANSVSNEIWTNAKASQLHVNCLQLIFWVLKKAKCLAELTTLENVSNSFRNTFESKKIMIIINFNNEIRLSMDFLFHWTTYRLALNSCQPQLSIETVDSFISDDNVMCNICRTNWRKCNHCMEPR